MKHRILLGMVGERVNLWTTPHLVYDGGLYWCPSKRFMVEIVDFSSAEVERITISTFEINIYLTGAIKN